MRMAASGPPFLVVAADTDSVTSVTTIYGQFGICREPRLVSCPNIYSHGNCSAVTPSVQMSHKLLHGLEGLRTRPQILINEGNDPSNGIQDPNPGDLK